ncbi:type IV conjugative transfer system protein TraV (plasmid) [Ahniella affigens]|uniref:Type IV conjugative transfer system protein TraV n=1 Tax=Ahniella affigens TaxID=2021234 RepID=A0A2P1PZI4_9GAMM|nr:type IV conjugative transfer system protein TraV [Ahniella affigens]
MHRLLSMLFIGLLAGCASSGKFSCGVPEGQPCKSALTVYAETDGASHMPAVGDRAQSPRNEVITTSDYMSVSETAEGELVLLPAPSTSNGAVPSEEPVREEAKMLRIWIAPWEDENGDLIAASHVYTEVEARRWRYGAPAIKEPPVLRLASPTPASPQANPTKNR